jgi:predicted amidophosphoribosyltransferase
MKNLRLMKTKINYCVNCEEDVKFTKGKCENCKGKYDDVVPASCREDVEYDYGK